MEWQETVMNNKQLIDLIIAWRKETLKTEPPKTADIADLVISTAEAQAEIGFKAGKESTKEEHGAISYLEGYQDGIRKVVEQLMEEGVDGLLVGEKWWEELKANAFKKKEGE